MANSTEQMASRSQGGQIANVETKTQKHIYFQQTMDSLEAACGRLGMFVEKIHGDISPVSGQEDLPDISLFDFLNSGPEYISSRVDKINKSIDQLEELLF